MAVRGAGLAYATGDRFKRAGLLWPLLVFYPVAWYQALKIHREMDTRFFDLKGSRPAYFNFGIFTGRSLIAVFRKRAS
jgi:hypothetical protein